MDGFQQLTAGEMMCIEGGSSGFGFGSLFVSEIIRVLAGGLNPAAILEQAISVLLDPIAAIFSYIFGIRLY